MGQMKELPFAAQSNHPTDTAISSERLVNAYLEPQQTGARNRYAVKGTPGLQYWTGLGLGPIYAMAGRGTDTFVLSGKEFFLLHFDKTAQYLGVVADGLDLYGATIAVSDSQVVLCCPPHVYLYNGSTFSRINPTDMFPVSSVAYLGGYFIYTEQGSGRFYVSGLLDAGTIDMADFATSESNPDVLLGAFAFRGEIWLFGQKTVEVWGQTGTSDFPFRRQVGAEINIGCISFKTVVGMDNAIFFVGSDLVIYRTNQYRPERISSFSLEERMANFDAIPFTVAFELSHIGHVQYCVMFPRAGDLLTGETWVFDVASQLWHERATMGAGGAMGRWRGQCGIRQLDFMLVGDGFSAGIMWHDSRFTTEMGEAVRRIITLPPLYAESVRASMFRLELEMAPTGAEAVGIILEVSDNGGRSWVTKPNRVSPYGTATNPRVVWNRLGMFRTRTLRFTVQTPERITLFGARADIQAGDN